MTLPLVPLASCASVGSNKVVIAIPPHITEPDRSLIVQCIGPVDPGQTKITVGQLEKLWTKDRVNLVNCARVHDALIEFIQTQNKLLKETK